MIKVQDWIASIPDEEKHVAYVGEGLSEQREFLLCGKDWEQYKQHSFLLDMAFDPVSITTHDSRQVVQTTHNSTEMKEEAGVTIDEVTTKETYMVDNVQTTNHNLTDIAPLDKVVQEDGIHLTWTILRQHTVLPGKLWATIRAVSDEPKQIKKSAIMVFEVEAAVCAVSAAVPPISEFEQMEERMDTIRRRAENAAEEAVASSTSAAIFAESAAENMRSTREAKEQAQQYATLAEGASDDAFTAVGQAQSAADTAADYAAQAGQQYKLAADQADSAAEAADKAKNYMSSTLSYAQEATISVIGAKDYMEQCMGYARQCEDYAASLTAAPSHISVGDFGAVGDGVTDDRPAILAAFTAAKNLIAQDVPCEVYFPAGVYGISNGVDLRLPKRKGGLLIRGDGREITTIKYLSRQEGGEYDSRYTLEVSPEGNPTFSDYDTYIHDVTIADLSICDNSAQSHGIRIGYCTRAEVTDCTLLGLGGTPIDVDGCEDAIVAHNHIEDCLTADTDDGAVLVRNGSHRVNVSANAIHTVHGAAIALGHPNDSADLSDVTLSDNVMSACDSGITCLGTHAKCGVAIRNNLITDCAGRAINGAGIQGVVTISGNTLRNIQGDSAANTSACTNSQQLISDNVFENIANTAVVCGGEVTMVNCLFNGVGTAATPLATLAPAINKQNGELIVSGCVLKNIRLNGVKNGIQSADRVENTNIELIAKNGVSSGGGDALVNTGSIIGGKFVGRIVIGQPNAIVQGVSIATTNIGHHAITIAANGVSITGCSISVNTISGRNAINENNGCNYNLIANNITNRPILTVGTQSVAANNLVTSTAT